ncbi:MAG: hypothetical protein KIS94_14440 [Chitinophagales bacterium]|nr:hypothetical protein [Chitinophagales bacterium]
MSSVLDNWNPPKTGKPEYFDTVKFIYKYIEFHISEDEAYSILNAFIEKWDASAGELIHEEELVKHVVESIRNNFDVVLPKNKIERVVHLILAYLQETGHFYQQEVKR